MNFYPFHIGDYAGATRHLSWDEDMAYRRMLDTYYSREQPLPIDRKQLYRLVGATEKRQREAVDTVLVEFFQETGDGWCNVRADEELAKAAEKAIESAGRKENEKERQRRHRARRKELFDTLRSHGVVPPFDVPSVTLEEMVTKYERNALVTRDTTRTQRLTNPNPNPNPNLSKKIVSHGVRTPSVDPEGFGDFWEAYPKRDGSADRKGAVKAFSAALKRAPLETIIDGTQHFAEAMQARGKVGTEYIPQARTWLNGDRWNERYDHANGADSRQAQNLAILEKYRA